MNSSAQTLADPRFPGNSIGISMATQTELLALLRSSLGAPLRGVAEAVTDAVRCPPPGMYAVASLNEADRQIARLNALRDAKDGWAGPGSTAPDAKSLNAAIGLINRLRHLPLPIPMASIGSHGNAGLFWSDARLYADIELLDDGRVGYLIHVTGASEVDDEEDLPSVGLPPAIAQALASAYLANR